MNELAGIRAEMCFPLFRDDGERFPAETWSWLLDETVRLMDDLPGSQGPWLMQSERYRWLSWTVKDDAQLSVLVEFTVKARQKFGVEAIYMDHYPITFRVITNERQWEDSS